jgi:hypothetical protein
MEWDTYAGHVRSLIEDLNGVEKVYYQKRGNNVLFKIYVDNEDDEILIHSVAAILWEINTYYNEREWDKDHYIELDFYPEFINRNRRY